MSGALSYPGSRAAIGAHFAIEEINAAGGIKALGGAKIEPVLGDAQSTPDGGNAEVEKMNAAGVVAVVGGYASSICLAASQTAARYDLPYIVDVGVVDAIVTRGLKNTFRFGPGFGVIAKTALDNLVTINDQAGKAARTVMIVHEDSAFGSGLAKLLNAQLPERGFQVLETIPHPTPTRDFNNVVLKIRAQNPDLVIPANYYNEYVLLARTMQQQRVRPKGIYSVLGGAASSYKFVKEFPEAAQYIMDCNHWFDPEEPEGARAEEEGRGQGRVLHLRGLHELLLHPAARRRDRARGERRPRQDQRCAGKLDVCRSPDALWSDQVRQRPEPGRGAGEHPGARQRHPGDLPGDLRIGEAGISDAAGLTGRAAACAPTAVVVMLSPVILVPAVLNGLLTGAIYALVALGLTLIYGVLHIINFAHGALLTAAMFAAFFAHRLLGLDPYIAAIILTPLFFALGYGLQRFVIGPASHGDDRNILLVTLGLAVVIENALLYAFRADTRTINLALRLRRLEVGIAFLAVPRVVAFAVVVAVALALWLLMRWTDTGKAIRAVAKEKLGAELAGIDVAHIYAVTFGLGTACLAIAACLLIPTYYVNPHVGNAFVLIAFTIVVLGGMGRCRSADRRLVRRRGREPVGALSRRIARPDRHFRDVHPGAAVPPERPVRGAGMRGLAPILLVRRAARGRAAASHRPTWCSISWWWRC